MTRCKQLLENFEKNIDILRKCGKDKSIIGRVARYVEFCKQHDIPYDIVPEGLVRPLVVKWHKGEEITEQIKEIQKIMEDHRARCESRIQKAEKVVEYYEGLEAVGEPLVKKQQNKLNKAKKIVKTKRVEASKETKKRIREVVAKSQRKFVPNGTQKVTIFLSENQYDAIQKHFNEGHEAKSKKDLASQIVAFLMQAVFKV